MTNFDRKWHLLYCDRAIRHCPVTEFIDDCQPKHQVKIIRFLDLLEEMGPTLQRPYADVLHDGIHELRIKLSGEQIRLLYFFCYQKYIVLYYGFVKNTSRVPETLINKVIAYRNDFMSRNAPGELEGIVREAI
ncbi:MAG: type II toxin-antitoxin system RelE/ParE family toxin [Deltaproteobacteria bacterium]|nr:type II toxin-antitoxin system RelE/ParE family toxin [Deltaproteobacteria bacterium]